MNATLGSLPLGGVPVDTITRPRTLAQQNEEDLKNAFFDPISGHGRTASFNPVGKTAFLVNGILENTNIVASASGEFSVAPITFTCRTREILSAKRNDKLVIDQTEFVIVNVDHDGSGVTVFALSEDMNG